MPKGRNNAPAGEADGIWYKHRGLPLDVYQLPYRNSHTSTGAMLSTQTRAQTLGYPPIPPPLYHSKDSKNFKLSNNFSRHDNRHSFQDHGVYFGNGHNERFLGKRLKDTTHRQHFTEKTFLEHNHWTSQKNESESVYSSDFRNKTAPPACHRRFPHRYSEREEGLALLTTSTVSQFTPPSVPYKTPLQVLASSQEPFLKHNNWKYSYHGKPKCYPAYDRVDRDNPYPVWMMLQQPSSQRHNEQHVQA